MWTEDICIIRNDSYCSRYMFLWLYCFVSLSSLSASTIFAFLNCVKHEATSTLIIAQAFKFSIFWIKKVDHREGEEANFWSMYVHHFSLVCSFRPLKNGFVCGMVSSVEEWFCLWNVFVRGGMVLFVEEWFRSWKNGFVRGRMVLFVEDWFRPWKNGFVWKTFLLFEQSKWQIELTSEWQSNQYAFSQKQPDCGNIALFTYVISFPSPAFCIQNLGYSSPGKHFISQSSLLPPNIWPPLKHSNSISKWWYLSHEYLPLVAERFSERT